MSVGAPSMSPLYFAVVLSCLPLLDAILSRTLIKTRYLTLNEALFYTGLLMGVWAEYIVQAAWP